MTPYKIAHIQLNPKPYDKPYEEIEGLIRNDLQCLVINGEHHSRHTFPPLLNIAKTFGILIFDNRNRKLSIEFNDFYVLMSIKNKIFQQYIEYNYINLFEDFLKQEQINNQ
jgi:hypothetical protein